MAPAGRRRGGRPARGSAGRRLPPAVAGSRSSPRWFHGGRQRDERRRMIDVAGIGGRSRRCARVRIADERVVVVSRAGVSRRRRYRRRSRAPVRTPPARHVRSSTLSPRRRPRVRARTTPRRQLHSATEMLTSRAVPVRVVRSVGQDGSGAASSAASSSRSWSSDAGEHEGDADDVERPTAAGRARASRWPRR